MTSEGKRVPAGGVVVIGPLSEETQALLGKAAHGKLAKIAESPMTQVVEGASDVRALTDRISKIVGNEGVVAPLFVDDAGHQLFPTGRMQVRFKQPPSDAILTNFAKRHNLELVHRNKWASQQAEFAVRTDDTRYFPDVTTALREDDKVATAWPDTRAAFRREE